MHIFADSAILLDLMQCLVHELQAVDTTAQRELLKAKFQLLTIPIDKDDSSFERVRHALQDGKH